ncbi:TerD family protein [Rhodococcus opacus]|uniref:TerD family protein n=1 Tax=Rhodococcus opacus TaxID=37919 RepID=UPI002E12B982
MRWTRTPRNVSCPSQRVGVGSVRSRVVLVELPMLSKAQSVLLPADVEQVEVDVSALLLNRARKVRSDAHLVDNLPESSDGSVQLMGICICSTHEGWARIVIDLTAVPVKVRTVPISPDVAPRSCSYLPHPDHRGRARPAARCHAHRDSCRVDTHRERPLAVAQYNAYPLVPPPRATLESQ